MRPQWRVSIFLCFLIAVFVCVFLLPRIPQDPAYHLFADGRTMLGIPNFFDIVSNLPFLVAGIWGLACIFPRSQTPAFRQQYERWPYAVFFIGVTLTCFGSAYYHWSPGNATLLWDRLPMSVAFMGIFAATIGDRIRARAGVQAMGPALAVGIFSVLYWYFSELNGSGDLRLYIFVQFFTIAAILLLLFLFPARYTHSGWLIGAAALYAAAKAFELLDSEIYRIAGISGHTVKHLVASGAGFCVIVMLRRRRAISCF